MVIPNRTIYVLSFASALCLASMWLPLMWCAKKTGQEAAPETSDTLSAIADTLPKTPVPLTDGRDWKTYRTVVIGGKTWMAENLNYQTGNSWCYESDNSNCNKYGRLYDWKTAMTACPSGWRLPSRAEWDDLGQAVGGERKPDNRGNIDWYGAGKKLKSTSGWSNNGNGRDTYGFSALPGGGRYTDGSFLYAGDYGYWWTATANGSGFAYFRYMYYNYDYLYEGINDVGVGFSVRCVGD